MMFHEILLKVQRCSKYNYPHGEASQDCLIGSCEGFTAVQHLFVCLFTLIIVDESFLSLVSTAHVVACCSTYGVCLWWGELWWASMGWRRPAFSTFGTAACKAQERHGQRPSFPKCSSVQCIDACCRVMSSRRSKQDLASRALCFAAWFRCFRDPISQAAIAKLSKDSCEDN